MATYLACVDVKRQEGHLNSRLTAIDLVHARAEDNNLKAKPKLGIPSFVLGSSGHCTC